ncbi:MAG: restriction endonuclease subunit S [Planctomycetes bacterium]|nr:restriction endonuclease subunit S [Planctomycetota bacterium]
MATRKPRKLGAVPVEHVLTMRALSENGLDPDALSELEVLGTLSNHQRLIAGDVLVSARSTRLAAALAPRELEGVPFNATLIAIRCLPVLAPRLLLAYLRHPDGRAAVESLAQSGTVQMNVTVRALRKLPVPVPPLAEQERLVSLLTAADEAYTAALAAAATRRNVAQNVVIKRLTSK